MRAGWRCPCISLALLLTYVVGSLLLLCPPLDPVGTSPNWGPRILSTTGADSIVFVALGPAARSASLLYALSSLREEGHWDGPVHVIVEHEDALDCLSSYLRQPVTIIVAPGSDGLPAADGDGVTGIVADDGSVGAGAGGIAAGTAGSAVGGVGDGRTGDRNMGVAISAKMAKMKLLELLPASVQRVVYVDCDVITQRPLGSFLAAVGREWSEIDRNTASSEVALADGVDGRPATGLHASSPSLSAGARGRTMKGLRPAVDRDGDKGIDARDNGPSTLILFPDAGGHTVPVCGGCDMAHSGVVALARGRSERCLQLWHDAFMGDGGEGTGTDTDQEALDIALRKGSGCEARWIDRHHMHFMKDPFVMAGLTRTSTFAHFTGLLHPERLSGFHRRHYEWFLGRSFDEWGEGVIKACAVK